MSFCKPTCGQNKPGVSCKECYPELEPESYEYWSDRKIEMPEVERRVLPEDSKTREQYPLFDGLLAYFPAALCEVARWSIVGNNKHNPGEPLHWAREKSTDHENKIIRHLLDARQVDSDGFVEAVALAWRALALCQTILEERGWAEGKNAKWLK